ncbi:MAG: amidohydrolase family protein [Candidatus Rokubacteria bacterium]|nr:amidohydrolase family protein [Candidatus Rokubacteria bacterium]
MSDPALDLLLVGGRVVIPESGEVRADLGIVDGTIAAILDGERRPAAREVIDLAGKVVFPGVIDPHTHVTLGPPDGWFTETRAAAVGGITTVLDFQLLSTSYVDAFPKLRAEADARACIDYGVHFCPSVESHLDELDRWVKELGVSSFKFYMNFRGDEGAYLGVAGADDGYLWELCQRVARHDRALLCLHTENIEIAKRLEARVISEGRQGLDAWGTTRPPVTEAENVHRAGFFSRETGCPVYVVHMSSAAALREVRLARAQGARVYAETCPQYLVHTEDSPLGLLAKCNPPLRTRADVDALWSGLLDGSIDTVGSDHVPRARAAKSGTTWKASRGTPTLPLIVPVMLHEGVHGHGMTLTRVAELISTTPARLFNLYPMKGTIQVGSDADLTICDLELEREVRWQDLQSYADYTLWEGQRLRGWPVMTVSRGRVVARNGAFLGAPGQGRYLVR